MFQDQQNGTLNQAQGPAHMLLAHDIALPHLWDAQLTHQDAILFYCKQSPACLPPYMARACLGSESWACIPIALSCPSLQGLQLAARLASGLCSAIRTDPFPGPGFVFLTPVDSFRYPYSIHTCSVLLLITELDQSMKLMLVFGLIFRTSGHIPLSTT